LAEFEFESFRFAWRALLAARWKARSVLRAAAGFGRHAHRAGSRKKILKSPPFNLLRSDIFTMEKIQSSTTLRFRPGTTLDVVDIYEELPFLGTEKRCAMECARAERDAARASGRHQRAPHAPASPRSRWRRARYPTRARRFEPVGVSRLASRRLVASRAGSRRVFLARADAESTRSASAPRRPEGDLEWWTLRARAAAFACVASAVLASGAAAEPAVASREANAVAARRDRARIVDDDAVSFFFDASARDDADARRHPSASRPSSKAKAPW
jgi:hypothetical protein